MNKEVLNDPATTQLEKKIALCEMYIMKAQGIIDLLNETGEYEDHPALIEMLNGFIALKDLQLRSTIWQLKGQTANTGEVANVD